MKIKRIVRLLLLVFLCNTLLAGAWAQGIADVARKEKEKKQQQPRTTGTPRVYTDENISAAKPGQPVSSATPEASQHDSATKPDAKTKASAAEWQQKIRQQKQVVSTLQDQTDKLQASIRFVEANAYSNGAQYNEAQRKKQEEIVKMQVRLAEEKKKLSDLQEGARKDGYGNSVYDPN